MSAKEKSYLNMEAVQSYEFNIRFLKKNFKDSTSVTSLNLDTYVASAWAHRGKMFILLSV